jgi:hypothetical protein
VKEISSPRERPSLTLTEKISSAGERLPGLDGKDNICRRGCY